MKKVGFALVLALGACASAMSATVDMPVDADVTASQFNSVASQYMERPTFVSVQKYPSGEVVMTIKRDDYGGKDRYGRDAATNVWFDVAGAKVILESIAKYREWNEQAKRERDIFVKEIAKTQTVKGGAVEAGFASGNADRHFLTLSFCAFGTCLSEDALFFTEEEVDDLEALLNDFVGGKVQPENVSSKYN